MNEIFLLLPWPWSQYGMDDKGVFVEIADADKANSGEFDSVWAYPEKLVGVLPAEAIDFAMGRYMRVPLPDALAHMDDDGVFVDEDSNAYVPIDE
jgi:hypothetical protein